VSQGEGKNENPQIGTRLLRGCRAYRCQTCGRGFLAQKALIDALLNAQRRRSPTSSSCSFSRLAD
jgi:hypothetical protein